MDKSLKIFIRFLFLTPGWLLMLFTIVPIIWIIEDKSFIECIRITYDWYWDLLTS